MLHQAGAYRHASHPPATMITGHAASTSRLIATKAAAAGTRLRSMPASRAGSPPMRSGVSAQAASPQAFSTRAVPERQRVAQTLDDPLDPPGADHEIDQHQRHAEEVGLQKGHCRGVMGRSSFAARSEYRAGTWRESHRSSVGARSRAARG